MAIKARGDTAIVQDPDEAMYPAMPLSAIAHVTPDAILPVAQMAAWILEHGPRAATIREAIQGSSQDESIAAES